MCALQVGKKSKKKNQEKFFFLNFFLRKVVALFLQNANFRENAVISFSLAKFQQSGY